MCKELERIYGVREGRPEKLPKVSEVNQSDIADMIGMRHQKIIEKLDGSKDGKTKGIIPILTEHDFVLSDYFIKSTYRDAFGLQVRECWMNGFGGVIWAYKRDMIKG